MVYQKIGISDGNKGDYGCLPSTKSFRKVWLESNTTFRVVSVDNFRETTGGNVPNGNSYSISSKPSLIAVSDFRGRFSGNVTD